MPTELRAPSFQLEHIHTRVVYDPGWEVGSPSNPAPVPDPAHPGQVIEPEGYAANIECIFSHSRSVVDPTGDGVVLQWCDLALARAWIRDLSNYVNTNGPSTFVDLPTPFAGPAMFGAPATSYTDAVKGLAFLNGLQTRFANIYNALNIPWSSHPAARHLFRKYLAGAPAGSDTVWPDGCGAQAGSSLYDVHTNYNNHWYRADQQLPMDARTNAARDKLQYAIDNGLGIIPSRARKTFLTYYENYDAALKHPTLFAQPFGLTTVPINPGEENEQDDQPGGASAATEFINVPVTGVHTQWFDWQSGFSGGAAGFTIDRSGRDYVGCVTSTGPDSDPNCIVSLTPYAGNSPIYTDAGAVMYQTGQRSPASAWALWSKTIWTLEHAELTNWGSPLRLWAPASEYLAWMLEWARVITASSPEQIIVDATRYAWFANQRIVESMGGAQQAFNAMVSTQSTIAFEEHQADAGVQTVAAAMGVAGTAAMATSNPYGAAIGIVLIAGAAVLKIWDAARTHTLNPHRLFRDDLGRFKPALEHPWLAGDGPGAGASNGPPNGSLFMVPEPDGFTRGGPGAMLPSHLRATLSRFMPPGIASPTTHAPSSPNTTSNPLADISGGGSRRWVKPALIAGGVVAAAGAAFGAYRYATRGKR